MSPDHSRPLEKKLMAAISLVLTHLVIQKTVLKAETVELADIPREKR
jgi:hypothetical protein